MVDFRYHLVSIIAIFMALALGIIVGTTQLNDQVLGNLKGSISSLTADKRGLESTTRQLQGEAARTDAFLESVAPDLVRGTLRGESVLLVTAPGAPDGLADAITPLLRQAGASLVGRLSVKPGLLDRQRGNALDDLVTAVRPPATALPSGEPVDRAALLLSLALLRSSADVGISETAAEQVLGGFEGEDLVDLRRQQGGPRRASLVVVLVPGAGTDPPDERTTQRHASLLTLVRSMDDRSEGAVVAGPVEATREAGLLRVLRDDDALATEVSSVDSADRPLGRVLLVQALEDQLRGVARSYGTGPGAQAAVPSAAPS